MHEFEIRHYEPEKDLTLLSKMLTAIEAADCDGEDTSEEYLLASLQWPNYRPNQDVWVAQSNGRLTGYAVALEQPSGQCTIYVVVHPSQRRNGLGSQLLALTLKRAREFDSNNILVYANEKNKGSNLFLKQHGFTIVGSSGSLKMPATMEVPNSTFPAEYSLKRYSEVNDPRILLDALNICYLDMWGHQHNEQRSAEELKSPRFLKYYDADNILLLFGNNNSIIGICSLKPEGKRESNGEVSDLLDGPGIIQALREKDLQRELVLTGIHHLRKKGTRPITLEFWGETENALKSYRQLGFEMFNHFITYTRSLV
jgi:mycothiol synthase